MKKNFLLFNAFLMIFLICSIDAFGSTSVLRFTTQEFPPFSYQIGGAVSGPASEIIRAICHDMNYKCSFKSLSWTRAQIEVKQGKAHGMFVIGWNENRAQWLHFSHPIVKTQYGFFVRDKDRLEYKKPDDIKGYNVGVYGPSNTAKSLEKIKRKVKDFTIDISPNSEICFRKLSDGRVNAVYSNKAVGHSLISKLRLKNIKYAGLDKNLKYYIGFSQKYNSKNVVDEFNNTLKKLYFKGVIQNILSMYNMEAADIELADLENQNIDK